MKLRSLPFWFKRAWLGVCHNSAQIFIAILLIWATLSGGIRESIIEASDGNPPADLLPMWVEWMWSGLLIFSALLIIVGIVSWVPRIEMAGITGKVLTGLMSVAILSIFTDNVAAKILWLILVVTGLMRYWALSVIEKATNKKVG